MMYELVRGLKGSMDEWVERWMNECIVLMDGMDGWMDCMFETEFLFYLLCEEFHFDGLSMYKNDVLWFRLTDELHYSLCIRMSAKRHVLHGHLHFHLTHQSISINQSINFDQFINQSISINQIQSFNQSI